MIQKQKSKKKLLLIAGLALVALGIGFAVHGLNTNDGRVSQAQKDSVKGQLDRENQKKAAKPDKQPAGQDADNRINVMPVITRYGQSGDGFEVAGYVQGTIEDGG